MDTNTLKFKIHISVKMKSLLVFLALVAVTLAALSPEQIAKVEPISKECREKTGATLEQIAKARQGIFEDDAKLKKQMLCVATKTGTISESGEIHGDSIKAKLKKAGASDETVADIEKNCFMKKGTPEETVFEFVKCAAKKQANFSPAD